MTSQIEVIRATLKYSTQEELIQGMAPLITRRGLFIHTRMTKPVGSEVQFEFRLADGSKVYSGEGVVRKEVPFIGGPSSQKSGMLVALRRINRAFKEVVDAILGSTDTDVSLKIAPDPEEAVKNQKIVQTHGGEGLDIFGDDDLDMGLDSLFSGIEKTPSRNKMPSGSFAKPADDFFGQNSAFSFSAQDEPDDMPTPLPATFGLSALNQNIAPNAPRATILTRSDQFAAIKSESQIRTGQFAAIKEIIKAERDVVKGQRAVITSETDAEDMFPAPEMLDDIDDMVLDDLDTSAFAESLSEAFSSDEISERIQADGADQAKTAADPRDVTKPPANADDISAETPDAPKKKISHTQLNTPIGTLETDEEAVKDELSKITGDTPALEEESLRKMTKPEPEEKFRPFWGQRNKIIDYESTLRKTSPYMTAIERNDSQSEAIRALHDRTAEIIQQEKIKAASAENNAPRKPDDSTEPWLGALSIDSDCIDDNAEPKPADEPATEIAKADETLATDADAIPDGTAQAAAQEPAAGEAANDETAQTSEPHAANEANAEDTGDAPSEEDKPETPAPAPQPSRPSGVLTPALSKLSGSHTAASDKLPKAPSALNASPKLPAIASPSASKLPDTPAAQDAPEHPLAGSGTPAADAALPAPNAAEPTTAEFPGNKDDTDIKDNQKEPDMNKRPSNSNFQIADEETPSQLFAALQEDMFSSIDSPAISPEEGEPAETEETAPAPETSVIEPQENIQETAIESQPAPSIESQSASNVENAQAAQQPEEDDEFVFDMPCLDMAAIESQKPEEPVNDPFANFSDVATLESMNGTSTPAVQRDSSNDIIMSEVTSSRQAVPRRRERNPEPVPPAPEPKKKGFFSKLFGR